MTVPANRTKVLWYCQSSRKSACVESLPADIFPFAALASPISGLHIISLASLGGTTAAYEAGAPSFARFGTLSMTRAR